MQCSLCRWLKRGHRFLLPKCVLGKPLVHLHADVPFWGYHPVPLNRWYCLLLWPCRGTSTSACVVYARIDDRLLEWPQACYSLFIICPCAVLKMTVKTGSCQNRTSRTACYGHATVHRLIHVKRKCMGLDTCDGASKTVLGSYRNLRRWHCIRKILRVPVSRIG